MGGRNPKAFKTNPMPLPHYNVVAAVVTDGARVLCMQKGTTRYAYTTGRWEFPGGKIEPGETPEQALHRELLEEMDYDVQVGSLLTTVTHAYPDFALTMAAYICTARTHTFRLKEHAAAQWLTVDALDALPWCAADVPIVEALKTHFCSILQTKQGAEAKE